MIFLGKKVDTDVFQTVNGKIVSEKEQVTLLGVNIDRNLNFNSHLKEICGKINQKTSAFAKL